MKTVVSYLACVKCLWMVMLCLQVLTHLQFKTSLGGKDNSVLFSWEGKCYSLSVQSLSCVQLSVTPWSAAHQASMSIINSRSLLKLMSIALVMPSNHLILWHPLLPPSISPSIRVFSNELVLHIRWPKYQVASVLPMNIQDCLPLRWTGWISL